jgi:hypothetical protein
MEKKQLELKLADYQKRYEQAKVHLNQANILVMQLEGAILAVQEMMKDLEPKPKK